VPVLSNAVVTTMTSSAFQVFEFDADVSVVPAVLLFVVMAPSYELPLDATGTGPALRQPAAANEVSA
jgi:hypothetical protein